MTQQNPLHSPSGKVGLRRRMSSAAMAAAARGNRATLVGAGAMAGARAATLVVGRERDPVSNHKLKTGILHNPWLTHTLALGVVVMEIIPSPVSAQSQPMPSLSAYELVFKDDFDGSLNTYNNGHGVWSTGPRRGDLMSNGPQAVFLSDQVKTADGEKVGINPLSVEGGALHISSGVIPEDKAALVAGALDNIGRGDQAGDVKYYTGMVSTADSFAQAYGYYEITASIPVGKGHWPAFWLAPAGIGWPPEIDIFEVYSKGVGGTRTGKDNTFSTAGFFDRYDVNGQPTQSVDWKNSYDLNPDGTPRDPMVKHLSGGEQYIFQHTTDAMKEFGADIYTGKWTWSAEWTPDYIAFYFGPDRDHLVEIYRMPTPADLQTPMYTIINDQISSTWGWNPVDGLDHLTFAKGNDFVIDSVSIYALKPGNVLSATGKNAVLIDGEKGSQINGSTGNDIIVTGGGAGQDFVNLNGGADIVHVTRGTGNAIITGFGGDDHIVLEGFTLDGASDAIHRLTQVGKDVWLSNGAYPGNPQTVIFRDTRVEDFRPDQFVVRWSETPDVWSSKTKTSAKIGDLDGDGIVRAVEGGSRMLDSSPGHVGPVTMIGSSAGDEYHVYGKGTVIVEAANGGVDTVYSLRSMTLAENVENLIATVGARNIVLTGNAGDNRIEGNGNANTLRGGLGDDLVITHSGADRIVHAFGDGDDVVKGFGAGDRIQLDGYAIPDPAALLARLVQDGNQVRLDLGAGGSITFHDTKLADFSADSFVVTPGGHNPFGQGVKDPYALPGTGSAGTAGPGTPPIETPPTETPGTPDPKPGDGASLQPPSDPSGKLLRAGLEGGTLRGDTLDDVILGGRGHDNLRGLNGNDWLDGGAGSNHLNGGLGQDTLVAQGSADRLYGGEGADLFIFGSSAKACAVMDFERGDHIDLSAKVEDLHDLRLVTAGAWTKLMLQEDGAWREFGAVRGANQADVWDAILIA